MNKPKPLTRKDFKFQQIIAKEATEKEYSFLLIKWKQCGHCTRYLPIYDQYALKHPDINFFIIEKTDKGTEELLRDWDEGYLSPSFVVNGYPTVIMYKGETPLDIDIDRMNLDAIIESQKH